MPVLKGSKVMLRVPVASDYTAWATLRRESRAFLERWEPRWAPDELERTSWRHRLGRYREDYAQGTAIAFFIFEGASGKLAGGITLATIRHGVSQSGHIGYWIGERYANRGPMTDAVNLPPRFALDRLRPHRIGAACIPDSVRTMRARDIAGLQREGLLRSYLKINGAWQDHYLYARIIEDDPDFRKTGCV